MKDLDSSHHIGAFIRLRRRTLGISQMELGDRIGVTYQQVQKYEKGHSELTISRLRQIAKALDTPVQAFLNIDAPMVAESSDKWLSDEEIRMLKNFRKIKRKFLRDGMVDMMHNIAKAGK